MDVNCGWSGVAAAGWFAGLLDSVVVVSGSFDGAGAGSLPSLEDQQDRDHVQVPGQCVSPVLRGECGSPWFRVSGDVVLAGHAASRAVA